MLSRDQALSIEIRKQIRVEQPMSLTRAHRARLAYRDRLRAAGRKEILLDLPEDLLAAIDRKVTGGARRGLVVEDLVRSALGMTPREH